MLSTTNIDTDEIYERYDNEDNRRRTTVQAAKAQRIRKDSRGKAARR